MLIAAWPNLSTFVLKEIYKTHEVLLDRGKLTAAPESFIFAELSTREFQIYSKGTDFKGGVGANSFNFAESQVVTEGC